MIKNFIIVFFLITSFVFFKKLFRQKQSLKKLDENLKFIYNNETDNRITIEGKELKNIAISINKILEKNKKDNIKVRGMQKSMKNTLTSISHDLRTPLTSISGYIQMIERETTSEERKKEYLQVIKGRVDTVKVILNQLFEYIRLENDELLVEREKINVGDILKDTIAIYYYDYLEKNVEPEILIPEKDIFINGDKNGLKRVFSNIIYNSLIHGEKDYKIELVQEMGKVYLTSENYTTSIEEKDAELVFERFFTSDKSKNKQTTGLGLCISKLLVEKMCGKIDANVNNNIFTIKIEFNENK
ncbi:HAMP domain-containing sensor histidine kinase [uncultured Clostridium sp.]|uniref:sensor histidine kinase n=1 Tax=uncultured Clostridium sp. TaxID=59620 RepID=UPI0026065B23|nr:HAMP domain-containing sensor histidine kinase [uncultured Clostridium sp.]